MQTQFVIVLTDVHCTWSGEPPRYRCYVNDELFVERTWIWTEHYLREQLQILAEPGQYNIRYELVGPANAKLKIKNYRIAQGPAVVDMWGKPRSKKGRITIRGATNENP